MEQEVVTCSSKASLCIEIGLTEEMELEDFAVIISSGRQCRDGESAAFGDRRRSEDRAENKRAK